MHRMTQAPATGVPVRVKTPTIFLDVRAHYSGRAQTTRARGGSETRVPNCSFVHNRQRIT